MVRVITSSSSASSRYKLRNAVPVGNKKEQTKKKISVPAAPTSTTASITSQYALRNAAAAGDYSKVASLLNEKEKGRNNILVNQQDKFGDTALHYACRSGYIDIVSLLVEKGKANVNILNKFQKTPQYYAELNGHDTVVKYLLSNSHQHFGTKPSVLKLKNNAIIVPGRDIIVTTPEEEDENSSSSLVTSQSKEASPIIRRDKEGTETKTNINIPQHQQQEGKTQNPITWILQILALHDEDEEQEHEVVSNNKYTIADDKKHQHQDKNVIMSAVKEDNNSTSSKLVASHHIGPPPAKRTDKERTETKTNSNSPQQQQGGEKTHQRNLTSCLLEVLALDDEDEEQEHGTCSNKKDTILGERKEQHTDEKNIMSTIKNDENASSSKLDAFHPVGAPPVKRTGKEGMETTTNSNIPHQQRDKDKTQRNLTTCLLEVLALDDEDKEQEHWTCSKNECTSIGERKEQHLDEKIVMSVVKEAPHAKRTDKEGTETKTSSNIRQQQQDKEKTERNVLSWLLEVLALDDDEETQEKGACSNILGKQKEQQKDEKFIMSAKHIFSNLVASPHEDEPPIKQKGKEVSKTKTSMITLQQQQDGEENQRNLIKWILEVLALDDYDEHKEQNHIDDPTKQHKELFGIDIIMRLKQILAFANDGKDQRGGANPFDCCKEKDTNRTSTEYNPEKEQDHSSNKCNHDDKYHAMQKEVINNIKLISRKGQVTKNNILHLLALDEEEAVPQQLTTITKDGAYQEDSLSFNNTLAWFLELLALNEEENGHQMIVSSNRSKKINNLLQKSVEFDDHENSPDELSKIEMNFQNQIQKMIENGRIEKKKILEFLALDDENQHLSDQKEHYNLETKKGSITEHQQHQQQQQRKQQQSILKGGCFNSKKKIEFHEKINTLLAKNQAEKDRLLQLFALEIERDYYNNSNVDNGYKNYENDDGDYLASIQRKQFEQLQNELNQIKLELQHKILENARQEAHMLQLETEKMKLKMKLLEKSKHDVQELQILKLRVEEANKEIQKDNACFVTDEPTSYDDKIKVFDFSNHKNNKKEASNHKNYNKVSPELLSRDWQTSSTLSKKIDIPLPIKKIKNYTTTNNIEKDEVEPAPSFHTTASSLYC